MFQSASGQGWWMSQFAPFNSLHLRNWNSQQMLRKANSYRFGSHAQLGVQRNHCVLQPKSCATGGASTSESGLQMKILKCLLSLILLAVPAAALAAKGRLGFTVDFTAQRTTFDATMSRVVVTQVGENSPAMRAGLLPGDVIEVVNGASVAGQSGRKFFKAMDAIQAGDVVKITVLRSGKTFSISIVAEES